MLSLLRMIHNRQVTVKYTSRFLFIPLAFFLYTSFLWLIVANRPLPRTTGGAEINDNEDQEGLKFPTCLEDVRKIFRILLLYKKNHWAYVYTLFAAAYMYKQTFAIPGSALLNILAGALIGCWPYGIVLCSALTAFGASCCFLLSKMAGRDLICHHFPAQVAWLQEKLAENDRQLLLYLIGLRLFPATPNWLINVVSPIVNIPLHLFFVSVFIGLLPYNFICLQAGETLSEVNSLDEIFTPKRLIVLLCLAAAVFSVSHFTSKRKVKFK